MHKGYNMHACVFVPIFSEGGGGGGGGRGYYFGRTSGEDFPEKAQKKGVCVKPIIIPEIFKDPVDTLISDKFPEMGGGGGGLGDG